MGYRDYAPPGPLLVGYDPFRDLPLDHLARLIEQVVEETLQPPPRPEGPGQPPYDPRLCVKVLIYSYCIGVRSSRVMERNCKENLAYLYLTRGAVPSYRTLCTARTEQGNAVEQVWLGLFQVAAEVGIPRLGRIVVDSTKVRANVSGESVLKREEFAAVRAELERIQAEVARLDAAEAREGSAGSTELGKVVPPAEMRDILRRVRRQRARERRRGGAAAGQDDEGPGAGSTGAGGETELLFPELRTESPSIPAPAPPPEGMTPKMMQRIQAALTAIQQALAENLDHLSLTDPDARMMYGERQRGRREAHSFEIVVDNGLLVAAQTTQIPHDNGRLVPLVKAAQKNEPGGIQAVDADSGYYSGAGVAALQQAGIDTCVPDSNTAGDLHRGAPIGTTIARSRGAVSFTYNPEQDAYHCPEGNTLERTQHRQHWGQMVTVYRAKEPCTGCPQSGECLKGANAQYRTLKVGDEQELLDKARARFGEAEHRERYRHRGERVETVFGFLRWVLGFQRWQLRGAKKVASEGQLFAAAYQFRKVHVAWAG